MQVRPQREQRHDEPDPPRRESRLRAQEQDEHGKERQGEELGPHDEERRGRGHDDREEDGRGRPVARAGAPEIEREHGDRRRDGGDLREDEALVAEQRLEAVEGELPERRRVMPPVRRNGRVRDRVRNRTGLRR